MANHSGIVDHGEFFQIIPNTRQIIVPPSHRIIGTVKSHNSEQLTFQCPKTIDGHDVVSCTKHWVFWKNANGKPGRDVITNENITTDDEYMYFTWTVSEDVTAGSGNVSIAVSFEDIVDGKTVYSWSTTTNRECQVLDTLTYTDGTSDNATVPEGYIKPAGSIHITENSNYDVSAYKVATVEVPQDEIVTLGTITKNDVYEAGTGKAFKRVVVQIQPKLQSKTATGNGTITPDSGYDGLSKVTVSVSGDTPNYVDNKRITENGTYYASDDGVDAYTSVNVNVQTALQEKNATPDESIQYIYPDDNFDGLKFVKVGAIPDEYVKPSGNKEITANGEYIDVAKYETVSVDIPTDMKNEETAKIYPDFTDGNIEVEPTTGSVLSKVTIVAPPTLIASNIKAGVTICGITGTFVGSSDSDDSGSGSSTPTYPDYGDDEEDESGSSSGSTTSNTMYIGASSSTSVTASTIKGFRSYSAVSGTYGFSTSSKGYIYICIPSTKVIRSISSGGFSVSMNNGGTVNIDDCSYDVYRTPGRVVAGSHSYTIQIS